MKIKTSELKLGDIILQNVKENDVYSKVVEIRENPVYAPVTFKPVYLAIIDGFIPSNGNRFGESALSLNVDEVEVVYRENPQKHITLEERLQNIKNVNNDGK